MGMLSLPTEVLENIILFGATGDGATSIAAVARTCRRLRETIYNPTDNKLWREAFLMHFDNPRENRCNHSELWDNWRDEFTRRIWAARFFKQHGAPLQLESSRALRSGTTRLFCFDTYNVPPAAFRLKALDAILSSIKLAAERSPTIRSPLSDILGDDPPTATAPTPPRVSLNIPWLSSAVLPSGHPAFFGARYSQPQDRALDGTPEALACAHLITLLGFRPTPFVESDNRLPPTSTPSYPPSNEPRLLTGSADMSEDAQRARAHCFARERVFAMRYLARQRGWGPYLTVTLEDDNPDAPPRRVGRLPRVAELSPDWQWLAAARILSECVLIRQGEKNFLRKLADWDNLRAGAWGTIALADGAEEDGADTPRRYERDWAGVTGLWRRLVCWLDYDDLEGVNTNTVPFDDPNIEEAALMMPMVLRVSGYSPAELPQYADRPTIHIAGESGGSDWDDDEAAMAAAPENVPGDVRRITGTVGMLADGSVRWNMTLSEDGGGRAEWTSESVQLGGVGSAMGFLGLWTGARHTRDDPVGTVWSWRVK